MQVLLSRMGPILALGDPYGIALGRGKSVSYLEVFRTAEWNSRGSRRSRPLTRIMSAVADAGSQYRAFALSPGSKHYFGAQSALPDDYTCSSACPVACPANPSPPPDRFAWRSCPLRAGRDRSDPEFATGSARGTRQPCRGLQSSSW
jgi:hypothetical protein